MSHPPVVVATFTPQGVLLHSPTQFPLSILRRAASGLHVVIGKLACFLRCLWLTLRHPDTNVTQECVQQLLGRHLLFNLLNRLVLLSPLQEQISHSHRQLPVRLVLLPSRRSEALSVCLVTDIISSEDGGLHFAILRHRSHIHGSKRLLCLPCQLRGNLAHPPTPGYFVCSHRAFKSGELCFDIIGIG